MATASKLKIPKSLAACADLYYKTRQERLAIEKSAETLKADEAALKDHLINNLPKSDATGVAGKLCRVSVQTKSVPQVADWDLFYAHVAKNRAKGGFALLNRAVNAAAVKEIWDAGKEVPGVAHFNAVVLSVNKV